MKNHFEFFAANSHKNINTKFEFGDILIIGDIEFSVYILMAIGGKKFKMIFHSIIFFNFYFKFIKNNHFEFFAANSHKNINTKFEFGDILIIGDIVLHNKRELICLYSYGYWRQKIQNDFSFHNFLQLLF
jgi:hypothetical protein